MSLIKRRVQSESAPGTPGPAPEKKPSEINFAKLDKTQPLHVRLRPQRLEDVIGHEAVVKSLRAQLASRAVPHSFLFTGPSGTGKTTLARIVGRTLGCEAGAVIEIDAARYSGVDNMREVLGNSRFASLAPNSRKKIVIDECHMLSKGAWNSLLLSIEEPPPHLWWSLCTTEPEKVPQTIRTRCVSYNLQPVPWEDIAGYIERLMQTEGVELCDASLKDIVARRANGSVRQALVYLSTVQGVTSKEEALRLIETVDSEDGSGIELARMICTGNGFSWEKAQALLKRLEGESPEGVRLVVVNYAAKMLMDTKKPDTAERLLAVLAAFSSPYNSSERQAPLLLSVGSLLFGG